MAVAISLTGTANLDDSSHQVSLASVAFGATAADRISLVTIGWSDSDDIDAVTINGNAAILIKAASNGDIKIECWAAGNPTGTTGPLVIAFTDNISSKVSVGIWSMTGTGGSSSLSDSQTTTGTATVSLNSVTIPTDGYGLFAVCCDDDGGITWTSATESYDHDIGFEGASGALRSTAGTTTVTAAETSGSGDDMAIIGMSWAATAGGVAGTRNFGAIIG